MPLVRQLPALYRLFGRQTCAQCMPLVSHIKKERTLRPPFMRRCGPLADCRSGFEIWHFFYIGQFISTRHSSAEADCWQIWDFVVFFQSEHCEIFGRRQEFLFVSEKLLSFCVFVCFASKNHKSSVAQEKQLWNQLLTRNIFVSYFVRKTVLWWRVLNFLRKFRTRHHNTVFLIK